MIINRSSVVGLLLFFGLPVTCFSYSLYSSQSAALTYCQSVMWSVCSSSPTCTAGTANDIGSGVTSMNVRCYNTTPVNYTAVAAFGTCSGSTVWNNSTNSCYTPTCPAAGTSTSLSVPVTTSTGAVQFYSGGGSSPQPIVKDNCNYTFTMSSVSMTNCYKPTGSSQEFCTATATSVGTSTASSNTVGTPTSSDVPQPSPTKTGCVTTNDSSGQPVESCPSASNGGTIQGNKVDSLNGASATINGTPVTATSSKNCGAVNGQYTCLTTSADATYQAANGSGTVSYFKFKPSSSTTTTTTTNPDGSTTKVETTTDNVIGSTPLVKTTTTGTNGNQTVSITGGQVGSPAQGDSAALQQIAKGIQQLNDKQSGGLSAGDSANLKDIDDQLKASKSVGTKTQPALNSLYTPIYTGGLSGVWDAKKSTLVGPNITNALNAMMPTNYTTGVVPTFTFPDAPFLPGSGSSIPFDSRIWDFIKAILIISALFLARSLIFGG